MEKFEIVPRYFRSLLFFLRSPFRFANETDFTAKKTKLDAFAFLVFGAATSIIAGQVNINFYDERIRRVIEVTDKVEAVFFSTIALTVFALLAFLGFRIFGGKASLPATIFLGMYAIAFTAPVLTLFLIVITRLESAVLNTTLVLVPPKRIIPFDTIEDTPSNRTIQTAFNGVLFAWNIYFAWLAWAALRALNKVGRLRAVAGFIATIVGLFAVVGVVNSVVNSSAEPLRPLWEWIFK